MAAGKTSIASPAHPQLFTSSNHPCASHLGLADGAALNANLNGHYALKERQSSQPQPSHLAQNGVAMAGSPGHECCWLLPALSAHCSSSQGNPLLLLPLQHRRAAAVATFSRTLQQKSPGSAERAVLQKIYYIYLYIFYMNGMLTYNLKINKKIFSSMITYWQTIEKSTLEQLKSTCNHTAQLKKKK